MTTAIDRWAATEHAGQTTWFVAAAGLLGTALAFASAPSHPITIALFTAALLAGLIGFVGPFDAWERAAHASTARRVGFAAVALQLGLIIAIPPEYFIPGTPGFDGTFYVVGNVMAAVIGIGLVAAHGWHGRVGLGGLSALVLAVGSWLILTTTTPLSDVWIFQQMGAEALLAGQNPYAITTYPDLYGPGSPFYAPELVEDGFLNFGFSYPPLSLLMAIPGFVLFGDHRFAQLGAMVAATWLIATARPGRLAVVPAILFLYTARTFLVLQQGWTDPFLVLLLAATVWLAVRRQAWAVLGLGLTVAVKQHMLLALPLGALLLRRATGRTAWQIGWQATAIAAAITLPFVLWDIGAFIKSTVWLHLVQPFRADSMSYVAWLGANGQPGLPLWIGFALLVPAMVLALVRAARTPAGFAAAVGVVLLVFFLFSKQSFVHYHYLVIGCLCVAAAAIQAPDAIDQRRG